jgi:ubiquinone biosynthesis protein COQ4
MSDDIYRVRWREGWDTLKYLYRHPFDTTQIARVIEAFQGRSLPRIVKRMRSRAGGRALLATRPSLRQALADRAWLESLPAGSLGRAYLDHCGEIGGMTTYVDDGTSPDRTRQLPEDEAYVQDYLFHGHDLYHLATGYDVDLIGEVCLLAFTAGQTRDTGTFAMALLGAYSLRLPRLGGQRLWARALIRAQRAAWLPEQNWVALLPRPLDEVRKQLGLDPPPRYKRVYIKARQPMARPDQLSSRDRRTDETRTT